MFNWKSIAKSLKLVVNITRHTLHG